MFDKWIICSWCIFHSYLSFLEKTWENYTVPRAAASVSMLHQISSNIFLRWRKAKCFANESRWPIKHPTPKAQGPSSVCSVAGSRSTRSPRRTCCPSRTCNLLKDAICYHTSHLSIDDDDDDDDDDDKLQNEEGTVAKIYPNAKQQGNLLPQLGHDRPQQCGEQHLCEPRSWNPVPATATRDDCITGKIWTHNNI